MTKEEEKRISQMIKEVSDKLLVLSQRIEELESKKKQQKEQAS